MASSWIHNSISSRQYRGAFVLPVLLFAIFFLSVNGWAACAQKNFYIRLTWGSCDGSLRTYQSNNGGLCNNQESCEWGGLSYNSCGGSSFRFQLNGTSTASNCKSFSGLQCTSFDQGQGVYNYSYNECSTQCEADSLACVSAGKTWFPGSGGECGTCNDNSVCEPLKQQCEQAGGVFSGSPSSGCCKATCDQCKQLDKQVQLKSQICCSQGMAPPDSVVICAVVARNTCGMNWSIFKSKDNEFKCQDPSLSEATAQRYVDKCFDNGSSSSGGGNSSSSGESSSSAGESSSSAGGGDYGDCKECPWLDSILDTLKAQKDIVSNIYMCITNPGLCSGNDENNDGDTVSIPDWVAEKMDSSLVFDTLKIHYIDSIKQVLESVLYTDSASLKADSIALHLLATDLENIDNTIKSLSDTTRDLFRRLTNSNKINTESLTVHMDSLYKYQKMISESMDSAIYGSGGFNKIDGLTDSAIKYFRQIHYFDSVYYENFADSLGALHGAISDIGVNIGYNLGYGDTASKTLRNDLEGIKGAIDGIVSMLGGSSVDTSGGQSWGGYIDDGERLGDSIVDASGWNQLKNTNLDTVFENALNEFQSPDSVDKENNDSLASLAARLNDSLVAQNDTIKSHLPDSLSIWADSLKVYAPFADFDSLIYSAIGAKIPNRDDCPEDCQKWTINIPRMGLNSYTVDFGLCLGRAPLGNQSVFAFLKLMLRIIVSWICIFLIYKTFVGLI